MAKRFFDIVVSIIAIILLLPVLLMVAILIKIDSKGGVIFKQARVGRLGRPFFIYKFRSMAQGSDKQGLYQTKENDPRITKVGGFIRKTSIDELPQLFNVIRGDMSLVGPRPNVFEQRSQYQLEEWDRRNSVRPGITGLAQATIRSSGLPGERTRLDLEYIDKQSFSYDMYILALTVRQLLIAKKVN